MQARLALAQANARLDGQRELTALLSHKLRSPIAALDYNMRTASMQEVANSADMSSQECMAMIVDICNELITKDGSEFARTLANEGWRLAPPNKADADSLVLATVLEKLRDAVGVLSTDLISSPRGSRQTKKQTLDILEAAWGSATELYKAHATVDIAQLAYFASLYEPVLSAVVETDVEPIVVLLVDDVYCLRAAQRSHLVCLSKHWKRQFEFIEASNGEECLEHLFEAKSPSCDVMIIDQYMHGAGGVLLGSETVKLARQSGFSGLIIGCSGNVDSEALFMAAGADQFWGKPAPPDFEVIQIFVKHLKLMDNDIRNDPRVLNVVAKESQPADTEAQGTADPTAFGQSKQAGGADSLSVGAFDPQVVRMLSRQLQPSLSPSEPSEAAQELADNLDRIIQMALGEMSDGIQQLECELCAAAAHKLKGLFGQLYLKEPYDVTGEISQMIRKGTDGDAVVAAVKHLRGLFDLVVKGEMIPDRTRFYTS